MREGETPQMELADAVSFDDVVAAAARLAPVAERTPTVTPAVLDELTGARIFLKCENFQRIGAFKFRGAYNALSQLDDEARQRGVLTYSSGNHAQAIALSSALLNIPAVIVMPATAMRIKLEATREYLAKAPAGSEIVTYDPKTEVREQLGSAIAEQRGLTVIPPYDHPHIIAGQGTAVMEMIEDAGELDALLVPCGGGGLLSGSAIAAHALCRRCHIIGVEPEMADDAARSFRDGVLRTVHNPPTIADGARTPYLGRYTFPIIRKRVDRFVTVSEREIAGAMRLCMERLKLVVEPTGALAVAGLLRIAMQQPDAVRGKRIGAIISGGNVDLDRVSELLASAGG
ncbi:MAG: threo-3-hydroxy-L-aspartate ammonia-lyase [Phycisphaerales bacterium JB039]